MYKLVDYTREFDKYHIKVDLFHVLDTDDDKVDTVTPEELEWYLNDGEIIDGTYIKNNILYVPKYNIKYKREIRGTKFRIYPTKEQEEIISKQLGCCRKMWNIMLGDRIDYYDSYKEKLDNHYTDYLDKFTFFNDKCISKRALQITERNLNTAYNRYFKSKGKIRLPKFKAKSNDESYQLYNDGNSFLFTSNKRIRVPKLGSVKIKYHRHIYGTIKTVTISKSPTNKYHLSMNTEELVRSPINKKNKIVGIDLGLEHLAILDDGTKIENPEYYKKYQEDLKIHQQQLSRTEYDKNTKTGSKRHEKKRLQVAKIHEKIANKRRDYLHKVTRKIVDENEVIITENLNVKGMLSNKHRSKRKVRRDRRIQDASWYEITREFEYKSKFGDSTYQKIDRFFPSTQICHNCGHRNIFLKGNTSIRTYICPNCKEFQDRDVSASINIREEGKRLLGIV